MEKSEKNVEQPVLSILIPTYNRAKCLEECLSAIADDAAVRAGSQVEVLISDNCSPDATREVCERFARAFPQAIVYRRQPRNLGPSDNFTYLIREGRGRFLKFLNDRVAVEPGAISRMLEIVQRHEAEHPLLYFGNEEMIHLPAGTYPMRSFDELADVLSYWTTSIGGYGLWRDEVDFVLPIQERYAASLLQQVAVIWNLFEKNKVGYLYNQKIYHHCAGCTPASGYNVAEVFSRNYLGILKPFVRPGALSKAAYSREMKRLYFGHIYGMYFDFEHCLNFQKTGFFRHTRDFWFKWYYWGSLLVVPLFAFIGGLSPATRQRFFNAIRAIRKVICRR